MANLLYFVVCFIHERYMALLPLLLLAVVLGFGKGLAPETVTAETGRNSEPNRAAKPGRSRGRGQSRGAQNKKETAVRTAATEKKADFRLPKSLLFRDHAFRVRRDPDDPPLHYRNAFTGGNRRN